MVSASLAEGDEAILKAFDGIYLIKLDVDEWSWDPPGFRFDGIPVFYKLDALGKSAWDVAWAEGRRMSLEEAVAYARARRGPPSRRTARPGRARRGASRVRVSSGGRPADDTRPAPARAAGATKARTAGVRAFVVSRGAGYPSWGVGVTTTPPSR